MPNQTASVWKRRSTFLLGALALFFLAPMPVFALLTVGTTATGPGAYSIDSVTYSSADSSLSTTVNFDTSGISGAFDLYLDLNGFNITGSGSPILTISSSDGTPFSQDFSGMITSGAVDYDSFVAGTTSVAVTFTISAADVTVATSNNTTHNVAFR